MATTTPNFGWPVPTSTDLVKDGATAIEALGDGVDASLVDLKGGTTGQVLSKTTNADMDFTWVTTDDANAIQNSIVDAKGDLISATANDTPARLAVGNNGETLVADSSTSTGLRYQAPVNSNPVLNSAMQVWQRATTFTISGFMYVADRWQAFRSTTGYTVSRQLTNDTTNLPFIQYALRGQRDSGNAATDIIYLAQSLETVNSIPYAGKTVTLSFYARAGANWSPTSGILRTRLFTGTGTDQNVLSSGYTGSSTPIDQNTALTTTWQRFTYTGAVPSSTTEIGLYFNATPVGTAGANDWFEITGVQIEVGSVATPFKTYAGTIQGELAACQRYLPAITTTSASEIGSGYNVSTTQPFVFIPFQVPTRVAPTGITATAANYAARNVGGTPVALTAIAYNNASVVGAALLGTVAAGLVAGQGTTITLNGTLLFTGCEL